MKFSKNVSKQQKGIVLQYVAYFMEKKKFLLIFIHLTDLIKKNCLNKSKFFSGFAPFQTW